MNSWLKLCPAWQFGLAWGGVMAVSVIVGGAAVQWLWHGHLDFSNLVGSAAGAMLTSFIAALAYRASKS